MVENIQRRLAAIVSADVVGYSRLMGADEAGTHSRLKARFSELVEPKIAEHGGRVVKLMGDGLLAEFPSVISAVIWAVEVQTKVGELNTKGADEQRIDYRVGVNLGDVIVDGDDIFGDGVNVAARLQGIAKTGGVCISEKVHAEVRGKLSAEFTDGGLQKVKNITDPLHVWHWSPNGQTSAETVVGKPDEPLSLPDKPSIAVLPFQNMSGDPEQEYFSDGVTEDIITALSRLRWLFVIARNSTFTYKGRAVDVKQVGLEMGVRYVLEGSVRKAGRRIRVTAQLIEADTGNHIWADRYDRDITDIFDLQDELTEAISGQVNAELANTEREQAHRKTPTDLDAWDLYQRGMWHYYKFAKDDNAEARRLLLRATEQSPEFAAAYAGLAAIDQSAALLGYAEDEIATMKRGVQYAEKSIKLDDRDGFGYYALGRNCANLGDRDRAIPALQKSVDLSPSSAASLFGLGYALWIFGRAEEGLPLFARAIRLSPHDPQLWMFHYLLSICNFAKGAFTEAASEAKVSIQVKGDEYWSHVALALAESKLGDAVAAQAAADRACELLPKLSIAYLELILGVLYPPYLETWLDTLRNAGMREQ